MPNTIAIVHGMPDPPDRSRPASREKRRRLALECGCEFLTTDDTDFISSIRVIREIRGSFLAASCVSIRDASWIDESFQFSGKHPLHL